MYVHVRTCTSGELVSLRDVVVAAAHHTQAGCAGKGSEEPQGSGAEVSTRVQPHQRTGAGRGEPAQCTCTYFKWISGALIEGGEWKKGDKSYITTFEKQI